MGLEKEYGFWKATRKKKDFRYLPDKSSHNSVGKHVH